MGSWKHMGGHEVQKRVLYINHFSLIFGQQTMGPQGPTQRKAHVPSVFGERGCATDSALPTMLDPLLSTKSGVAARACPTYWFVVRPCQSPRNWVITETSRSTVRPGLDLLLQRVGVQAEVFFLDQGLSPHGAALGCEQCARLRTCVPKDLGGWNAWLKDPALKKSMHKVEQLNIGKRREDDA